MGEDFAQTFDQLAAFGLGCGVGGDGLSTLRQLINHRDIHVGVQSHGQGAGYGRRCHHQLVGIGALVLQGHALVHAETMLFIDDGQRELVKHYLVLKQGVGADDHLHVAAGDTRQSLALVFCGHLAREQGHFNAQWCQPLLEIELMLFG